jgi:hypothetical protein
MPKREFPKAMSLYIDVSSKNGYNKEFVKSDLVWSKTEYNSYVTNYDKKGYFLSERKPHWKELKGMNFFKRVYYLFPIQITYSVGVIIGFIIGHLDTIIKYGKEVVQLLFPE